jgi:hypothetical protein
VTMLHQVLQLFGAFNYLLVSHNMFHRLILRYFIYFQLRIAAFKAYCAIWVRRSNFRHQASPRVSPRESTQRRKVELWVRNALVSPRESTQRRKVELWVRNALLL